MWIQHHLKKYFCFTQESPEKSKGTLCSQTLFPCLATGGVGNFSSRLAEAPRESSVYGLFNIPTWLYTGISDLFDYAPKKLHLPCDTCIAVSDLIPWEKLGRIQMHPRKQFMWSGVKFYKKPQTWMNLEAHVPFQHRTSMKLPSCLTGWINLKRDFEPQAINPWPQLLLTLNVRK